MIGIVIGSSRIATIHLRALIKKKLSKIYSVSRSKKKSINFIKKNNFEKFGVIPSDYEILKTKKKKFICVCVNTKYHYECIKKIYSKGSITIVEKPIISGLKYKNNYLNILSEIYSKHKKILVCYPMFYLAKSFKKNFKIDKNIYKINIYYQTNGNHTYGDIGEDLLPHAISLIVGFGKNSQMKVKPNNFTCLVSKNSWRGSFYINETKINLNFKENKKLNKSKFYFKINDKVVLRPTKIINGKFINYLSYKNKLVEISNPMDDCLKYYLNNTNNKKNFEFNKKFTYYLMKINQNFII